jgi:hypothetical protein
VGLSFVPAQYQKKEKYQLQKEKNNKSNQINLWQDFECCKTSGNGLQLSMHDFIET